MIPSTNIDIDSNSEKASAISLARDERTTGITSVRWREFARLLFVMQLHEMCIAIKTIIAFYTRGVHSPKPMMHRPYCIFPISIFYFPLFPQNLYIPSNFVQFTLLFASPTLTTIHLCIMLYAY